MTLAGRRTRHDLSGRRADVGYVYDVTGELDPYPREPDSGSNVLLASYAYDDRGRRTR